METVARIKKDGTFTSKGEINERLPVITNGLIAYYPLDSKAGGIDIIGGNGTVQNIEQNINYLDALNNGGWRNPNNWTINCTYDESKQAIKFVGGQNGYLKIPIIIDTTKHYEIQMSVYVESYSAGTLYLGGMGYDSVGAQVTTNWMYFLAVGHDYPSLVGKWTTFKITLSGTGALPYLNSYSFSTYPSEAGGWSENGRTTYKYYYGGLFNYQSTGTMYIKDCIVRTVDPDTSNIIESNNGIAVQDGTTNLVTSHVKLFSNWGGLVGSSSYFIAPNGHQGISLIANSSGGVGWSSTNTITALENTTYTVSCKIKATIWSNVSQNFFYIRQYGSSGQISEYGIYNGTNRTKLDNDFYYTWATFTTTTGVTSFIVQSYQYSTDMICAYDLQVQRLSYPLEYVGAGITTLNSNLKIPLSISTFPFTVSVNVRNLMHNGQNSEVGEVTLGYPISWWTISGGNKGVLGQYARTTSAFQQESFRITLICRTNNYTIYFDDTVVYNGVYYNNIASPFTTPISLGTRNFEEDGRFNGIYSECSIFNREISINEIKTLMNDKLKLTPNYVITNNVIEKSYNLDDCYYFPLSNDASDVYKTVNASTTDDILFEDGAVYVGTATTNLIPQDGNYTVVGNGTIPMIVNTPNIVLYSHSYNENLTWSYHGYDLTILNSSYYTYSVDAVVTKDFSFGGSSFFIANCEGNFGAGCYYNTSDLGKWKRFTTTSTSNGTGARPLLYPNTDTALSTTGKIYYKNWMLCNKPYRPCFCIGTSGNGNLSYNFNQSIGLNWAGDWSICYWKKPVSTHSNNLSGYNIESVGCNSNSVGGGYMWYGKPDGSNIISGSNSFTQSDYFNKWQFISMVKTGTSILIKTILDNGVVYTRTVSTTNTVTNYYVTQYGYDFKLGGWDNSNPTNTYFRDLIVVKHALSETDITNIYKQFSITKYNLYTHNLIEQGI